MKRLRAIVERLRRSNPHIDKTGQMYSDKVQLERRYRRVVLYTLFLSDENTHMIRPHVFDKKRHMSGQEWASWFSEHLTKIHVGTILPALSARTGGKAWSVQQIMGWVGNAKYATRPTAKRAKRNKTKSKGRARG